MISLIQAILTVSVIGGSICTIVGTTLIPQTVTNNGNAYIGTAEAYEADLHKAQLASYGFKVVIVGISIFGGSFLLLLLSCYKGRLTCIRVSPESQESRVSPENPVTPERTVIPILQEKNIRIYPHTVGADKLTKWAGRNYAAKTSFSNPQEFP